MAETENPVAKLLFEISWEVCNKVGGIHTVVRSKLPFIKKKYENYVCIGPAVGLHRHEFDARTAPSEWQEVFHVLENRGIICHYGVWLAPGEPDVILIDFEGLKNLSDELKGKYWEHFQIDSINSRWDFVEPMLFSTAAGMVIEEFVKRHPQRTVVHAHEWMSGFALLHLKMVGAHVGTVFTTHATMLGRSIAGGGHHLYDMIDDMDPNHWAYKMGVQEKHTTEVACAHYSDVFTTVSEITGLEAEKLLGKKPDVLLFNGFQTDRFPTFEETSIRHNETREILREFIAYNFFPYYQFDIEKTILFYTSGRFEYGNKGLDVLVQALAQLNKKLVEKHINVTVVMFFWVLDMGHGAVRRDVLETKNFYYNIKNYVEWHSKPLMKKIILDVLCGKVPGKEDDQFTSSFMRELHQDVSHFKREGQPAIVTHNIPYSERDPLIQSLTAHNLLNSSEDKVKVVVYPGILDGSDGLLNLQYYDAVVGTHLGIFPSRYEPWGYTPLESGVLGVPAVTTDLAGFGRYVQASEGPKKGVYVINRHRKSHEEIVKELSEKMFEFLKLNHNERVQEGFAAKTLSDLCSWNNFGQRYIHAHNRSLKK